MPHPLQTEIAAANAIKLSLAGQSCTFKPAGGADETVVLIFRNPTGEVGAPVRLMAWGSAAKSGVSRVPDKNDEITFNSKAYRVFAEPIIFEDGDSFEVALNQK